MLGSWFCLMLLACGGGGGGGAATSAATPSAAPTVAGSVPAPATIPAQALGGSPDAGTQVGVTQGNELGFSFDLPGTRTTSAGVYAGDGRLLRTLWRGERLAAGRHARVWDLRLDDGSAAQAGDVTVRVVHHDVKYQWQGAVGNSSAQAGRLPFRSFLPPTSLAVDGGQLHIALGYNEAQSALTGLRFDDPQRPAPAFEHKDPFIGIGLVASDGASIYMAQTGGISKAGFVFARRRIDGQAVVFDQGQPLCLNRLADGRCYPGQTYASVLGWRPQGEALPTGLAVQRGGRLLAVAYAAEQSVRVFDKTSGVLLAQWTAPLARQGRNQLAMGPDGDLWLLSDDGVSRYTSIADQPRRVSTIPGLVQPLALATDPADASRVWVAEGGNLQQVRRFGRGGVPDRVLGQPGGLRAGAPAAPDRLCFTSNATEAHTALALDGSEQVWVVDTCNNRLQRFGSDGAVTASVAWLPASYVSAVDATRPQRVFANFLEFEVADTRTPDGALNWRLVRNWLPGLPPALQDERTLNLHWGGFQLVTTLANGRAYAQMKAGAASVIVELGSDGLVREVRRLVPAPGARSPEVLQPNGDLHHATDEGTQQVVHVRRLEGYTAAGEPRWADTSTVLARLPMSSTAPHYRMGAFAGPTGPRWPLTASGMVVSLDPSVDAREGFHLGAARAGDSAWAWQASPGGPLDGLGSFQTRASDARITYGGNVALTAGRSIVYGFHGEFYTDLGNGRVGQANQFMHFLDNGLFVGQFGRPSTLGDTAPEPGLSGNAFSPSMVQAGARTFVYHNDESSWGGVHRWELQGLDDIVELRASGPRGSTLTLR